MFYLNQINMKKIVLTCMASLAIFACTKKEEAVSLNGTYSMDSQSIYDAKTDSLLQTAEKNKQIKIYTDGHYLWVNVGADSTGNFGIGSYVNSNGAVEETNIYNSGGSETADVYHLKVEGTENGYKQHIANMKYNGKDIKIEEAYSRMQESAAGEFDGLWKATSNYYVKGKDTTVRNYPDYKIMNKGHFAWGVRALMDTTNKKYVSYVGSGTFAVNGDKVKELTTLSNIAGNGETNLTIVAKKEGEFVQAINQPDGSVRYTVYSKVK